MRFEFHGDEELLRDFMTLTKSYHSYGENALKRAGRKYKAALRKNVRSSVKSDKKLTKGFSTRGPHGVYAEDLWLEFIPEGKHNPHWHLVEHGHDIVRQDRNMWKKPYKDAGAILGHVAGKEQIRALHDSGELDPIMEREMLTALDQALEAGDLK